MGRVYLRYSAAPGPARRHLLLHGILRPGGAACAAFRQAHPPKSVGTQGGTNRSRRVPVSVAAVLLRQTLVSRAIGARIPLDRRRRPVNSLKPMKRSSYADLPERFYARVNPTPVDDARLLEFNRPLCAELGLDAGGLEPKELADIYSGNVVPMALAPIAMAYAGHQFGQFVPQLGDGRAILLGEAQGRDGVRRDVQLKGSGRTPFSRGGDGRAALGPVLREYLVSEAMHALGIPTTRALAAVATGEPVFREEALPGAVLTRVAASFVRVGTFQYFAARNDVDAVRRLADYVIDRHYPEAKSEQQPYLALLRAVIDAQASLIASWMHVGFIHGVMNTDNMALSGETIDFGPCAFLDAYDPDTVFSSIDRQGRYAYGNQPHAAVWNLARFAETLLPIIDADAALAGGRHGE